MATSSGSKGKKFDENTPERIKEIAKIHKGEIEVNSGVITDPSESIKKGTTYQLARAGATRFAMGKGLLNIGIPISKAVKLNMEAAKIGTFKIKKEESVAAGIRRIKAIVE